MKQFGNISVDNRVNIGIIILQKQMNDAENYGTINLCPFFLICMTLF